MNCRNIHKRLVFFLEGDIPEPEAEEIAKHRVQCPTCAAFAEDLKKTLQIVQLEKLPAVNPFFYTRLKARMQKEAEGVVQPAGFQLWGKVLQPALFSMLLLIGIYTGIKIGQPVSGGESTIDYAAQELIPYLNEMEAEPLEAFLME